MTTINQDAPLVQLEWERAKELIDNASTIAVVTHVNPDGDAIGSLMGMVLALREQGKKVTPYVDGGCPKVFRFIPGTEDILGEIDDIQPDLVISTDSSDLQRIGIVGAALTQKGVPYIQLDHHQTNRIFGDVNLVDARTVAAAEGVFDLIETFGWELSQAAAQALLTGIVTDTLCFRTSNITAPVFAKVQRLMEAGADLTLIVQNTMARQSTVLHRLQARVLNRMKVEDGVIWLPLYGEDFRAFGLPTKTYTGLASYLIQADEAYISATFKEIEPNEIECSFRATPGFDVSQIALQLGGGGHVLASGCTIRGKSIQEVQSEVVALLKEQVKRGAPVYK